MKRIKIFKSSSYSRDLESVVNEWLEKNQELNVVDIKTATGSRADDMIVTVIYKDPGKVRN